MYMPGISERNAACKHIVVIMLCGPIPGFLKKIPSHAINWVNDHVQTNICCSKFYWILPSENHTDALDVREDVQFKQTKIVLKVFSFNALRFIFQKTTFYLHVFCVNKEQKT